MIADLAIFSELLEPLEDRVLLLPDAEDDQLKEHPNLRDSGFDVPDIEDPERHKKPPQRGTIVAVGDGRMKDGSAVTMALGLGDRVLFSVYGMVEFDWTDEATGNVTHLLAIRLGEVVVKLKRG